MILTKPLNKDEIVKCVDMYIVHDTWLRSCRKTAINTLYTAWHTNKYVRIVKDKDEIIAFLYAEIVKSGHYDFYILQQNYFCSIGGIKGIKAMLMLHDDLVQHAEELNIKLVISPGSHFDEENKFTKALEKHGWERRGFLAAYKTSHY